MKTIDISNIVSSNVLVTIGAFIEIAKDEEVTLTDRDDCYKATVKINNSTFTSYIPKEVYHETFIDSVPQMARKEAV